MPTPIAPLTQCWLARPTSRLAKSYSDKAPPLPSYEGNHISTLKSGGRGRGRIAGRHLGTYSSSTCEIASFHQKPSDPATAQCNCKARRAVPRRRQAGAAARRDALRWRSGAGWGCNGSRRAASGAREAPSRSRRAPPRWRRSAPQRASATKRSEKRKATQGRHSRATVSSHSLKSIGPQSDHSRITVGSQSGHSRVTVGS